MKKVRKISELQYLENYRLLFLNLETIADLKRSWQSEGDDAKIAEGKVIYDETQSYTIRIRRD